MQCNYCQMKAIKHTASRAGLVVVEQESPAPGGFMNGVRVSVKAKNEVLDRDKHFVAWFAKVPLSCVC